MERLPDLILEQAQDLPNVVDPGHEWYVYRLSGGELHAEPSRTGHDHAEREPDYLARVTCKKAFADTPEKIYAEIVRQLLEHVRRCITSRGE